MRLAYYHLNPQHLYPHFRGSLQIFDNSRNISLFELLDHYRIIRFFDLSRQSWSLSKPSGELTDVQFVTADTNLPVIIVDQEVRFGKPSNETDSLFLLTNSGTPRRHRCLRSK